MAAENTFNEIYVHPIEPQFDEEMKRHFAKHGELESYHNGNGDIAFIKYKDATSAAAAAGNRKIMICEKMVNVKPIYELSWPPHEDSPSNIRNCLNDDCLMEILKRLHPQDLCSMAEVCTHFKSNAEIVFAGRFRTLVLMEGKIQGTDCDATLKLVVRLFHNFGSKIEILGLSRCPYNRTCNDQLMRLLLKYCSELKELTLQAFNLKGDLLDELKPMIIRLKKLAFIDGKYDENFSSLLSECHELTELILGVQNFEPFLKAKIPNLELMRFLIPIADFPAFPKLPKRALNDGILNRFMKLNPTIKTLEILNLFHLLTTDIFQSIGTYLPNLEELRISKYTDGKRGVEKSATYLARLGNLKCLGLDCQKWPNELHLFLNALATAAVPIETLDLSNIIVDSRVADNIVKFKSIKMLALSRFTIASGQLVRMVKELPHLNELDVSEVEHLSADEVKEIIKNGKEIAKLLLDYYEGELILNRNDFTAIVQSLKDRNNGVKLNIVIDGGKCKLNVREDIIQRSLEWLTFTVTEDKDQSDSSRDTDDENDL